jgi:HEAT repeat protein
MASILAACAAALSLEGCTTGPAPGEAGGDSWSSKAESTVNSDLPPRAEIPLGDAFAVTVNQADLRGSALEILHRAADSTNPLLRANAIQAFEYAPTLAPDALRKALGDDNRAVRFVATMTVGEMKLIDLAPLVEPLLLDESQSVHAAAIYALRRCGRKPNMNPLASMIMGDDPEVRGNAALVLGELADPSALPLLRASLGRGMFKASTSRRRMVELQIAEAMVKLGDIEQLEVIRAALFSRPEEGEVTALACQICGEIKDEGSLPNLLDMATRTGRAKQSAEIRMAAATAVAQINRAQAVLAVPLGYVSANRYELRAQAAASLGATAQHVALPYLASLMQDSNPLVQVSAAAAVLQIEK